jgi:hypothetical protein
MSQIVDANLTFADLPGLGSRLVPPTNWTYSARTLDATLSMRAYGQAVVIQDEYQNTYQRVTPADDTNPLPVLEDGTGTNCSTDTDCQGLDADHCLLSSEFGYCTIEGCASGECGTPYVCCFGCNPAVAPMLPFEGSACIPEAATGMLTGQAGCTCD